MAKFSKYFNSTTLRGRANVAKATYASFAALYLYTHFVRKRKNSLESEKSKHVIMGPQGSDRAEHLKCPACDKPNNAIGDETVKKQKELHQPTPPTESAEKPSSDKLLNKEDNSSAIAESVVKTSRIKSESNTKSEDRDKPTITTFQQELLEDKKCVFLM